MNQEKRILSGLFLAALCLGLAGINWDRPSSARAERVLSPDWDRAGLFNALTSGWQDIYDRSRGSTPVLAEIEGKYSTRLKGTAKADPGKGLPPGFLLNSYRSMLIRSRYPDESLPLSDLAQMKPAKLDFRPPSFLYGGGYLYPLGAWYFALSKTGAVKRLPMRGMLEDPDALGRIFTAGRIISALAFAGICCLCFLLAGELSGAAAGTLAFAAAMTAPLFLAHAHLLTPHLWSAFWGLASVLLLMKGLPELNAGLLAFSGACLGLSAGSYWSQFHAAVFHAALLFSAGTGPFRTKQALRLLLVPAAAAAVFLLLNPYLPGDWRLAVKEMFPSSPLPASYARSLAALFGSVLPKSVGLSCTLAIVCGYIWGLLSRKPAVRWLAAACVVMALLAALVVPADFPAGVRRFFPWLAISLLLAALAVHSAISKMSSMLLKAALAAAFLLPGFAMSYVYTLNFVRADSADATFSRMAGELDSMKPDGRLGLLEFPQPAYTPHFRLDRWPLLFTTDEALAGLDRGELPRYLLVTAYQKPGVQNVLDEKYGLVSGFYPASALAFSPDPLISPANAAIELYALKGAP